MSNPLEETFLRHKEALTKHYALHVTQPQILREMRKHGARDLRTMIEEKAHEAALKELAHDGVR